MENWSQVYDETYEKWYYYNNVTGETMWELPAQNENEVQTETEVIPLEGENIVVQESNPPTTEEWVTRHTFN